MLGLLPSAMVLGLAAVVAAMLTTGRPQRPARHQDQSAASRALALAVAAQALHFAEEAATGFPLELGAIFGLPAMPSTFFLAFNISWLAVWIGATRALRSDQAWAWFASWFLSIAGIANGVLHPGLSAVTRGYFPGLWSSPLIAVASLRLWIALRRAAAAAT